MIKRKWQAIGPWLIIFLFFFLINLFVRFVVLPVLSLYIPAVREIREGVIAEFLESLSFGAGFTFMIWFVWWWNKRFKSKL